MNIFRVKKSNVDKVLKLFPNARVVPAPTNLNCGCGDPECCPQHSGFIDGEQAAGIQIDMSGSAFNKALRREGIVK